MSGLCKVERGRVGPEKPEDALHQDEMAGAWEHALPAEMAFARVLASHWNPIRASRLSIWGSSKVLQFTAAWDKCSSKSGEKTHACRWGSHDNTSYMGWSLKIFGDVLDFLQRQDVKDPLCEQRYDSLPEWLHTHSLWGKSEYHSHQHCLGSKEAMNYQGKCLWMNRRE